MVLDIQLLLFLSPVYFSSKCFDLLTTDRRSESRHSGCRHQNISPYLLWECLCVSISLRFLAFHSLIHSPQPPAVLIGDTDTGLLHLLFFANVALLLQCLFLLPSDLPSALCKCHSSSVISLGRCEFRVRSVMLSVKYHSNSTQQ